MRALARQLGLSLAASAGIPRMLHQLAFRRRVSVLMYHAVIEHPLEVDDWCFLQRQAFVDQLAYLIKYFDIVTLTEACARMYDGSVSRPTVALTFDDGFQNNYDVVFPILKAAGVPATIFL